MGESNVTESLKSPPPSGCIPGAPCTLASSSEDCLYITVRKGPYFAGFVNFVCFLRLSLTPGRDASIQKKLLHDTLLLPLALIFFLLFFFCNVPSWRG